MRADRPVLAAAVFLAAGLSVLFCYGTSGSGLNAALPFSNSSFHLTLATVGPAAIGGVVLTIIGGLFLVWAILAALAWHWRLVTGKEKRRGLAAESYTHNPPASAGYQAPVTGTEGHRRYM
jgi:predicted permease